MLTFIQNLASFVVALGILVAVHEWGHFWVARRCGVKVERFSIGFGRALWKRKDKLGTEFVIAAIPLGGYVKMVDERAEHVSDADLPYAFNRQPVLKRIAIIAAGPLTNFVFAVFALFLMYLIGLETVKPIIGSVQPDSLAEQAQLQVNDEIVQIGKRQTPDWEAINLELISSIGGDSIPLTVREAGSNRLVNRVINTQNWEFDPEKESALTSLGLVPFRPAATMELAYVAENSAASAAGMQVGDKILQVDGTTAANWEQIVGYVSQRPGQEVQFVVLREGQRLTLNSIIGERDIDAPGTANSGRGVLGVIAKSLPWPDSYRFTHQYNPLSAAGMALDKT